MAAITNAHESRKPFLCKTPPKSARVFHTSDQHDCHHQHTEYPSYARHLQQAVKIHHSMYFTIWMFSHMERTSAFPHLRPTRLPLTTHILPKDASYARHLGKSSAFPTPDNHTTAKHDCHYQCAEHWGCWLQRTPPRNGQTSFDFPRELGLDIHNLLVLTFIILLPKDTTVCIRRVATNTASPTLCNLPTQKH